MNDKQILQISNLFNYKGTNHSKMIKNLHSHTFLGPSYCDLVWVEITPNGDKFDVGWMYRGKETPFEQKSLKFSDVKKIVKGYQ